MALLGDHETGLEVNGELINEGKSVRLERVYIKSPRNVEIAVYPHKEGLKEGRNIKSISNFIKILKFARDLELNPVKVTVGYEGDYTPREFDFNESIELGVLDCHLSILSHQSTRKTGIVLTLTGSNGEPIEFHVGIKNGKDSLRFEILDSSGLAQAKLSKTNCLDQV